MSLNFARLLQDQEQVFQFLTISLGVKVEDYPDIVYDIITSEKGIIDGLQNPTSTVPKFRDRAYATDELRQELRKRIVDELFSDELLEDDDKIELGNGGARPAKLRQDKQAFFLSGLPASGKSSVAAELAKQYGAMILDSDFAKRKLPEYSKYPWGASIVHAESSMIIFGDEAKTGLTSLYSRAVTDENNIVIPKVGSEPDDIIPYCESLKNAGYTVHLILVYLPKEKSTARALSRFHKSKRYVPLASIFDVYGSNPALTYFLLKNREPNFIDSYGIVNTDVSIGNPFLCTDIKNDSPAGKLYNIQKNGLI